jgi:hypothetical protein
MMAYRDESVAWRFLALSPAQLTSLRRHCPDAISRASRLREGCVTGVFDLHEGVDYDWIGTFIEEHAIASDQYGLFVSISTSSDSEIVLTPGFAVELVRKFGGVVHFSFTVLSEDE